MNILEQRLKFRFLNLIERLITGDLPLSDQPKEVLLIEVFLMLEMPDVRDLEAV